ncbi:MAG: hypothetical protein KAY37_08780 [Phycisphaerae bacterium]|nr:hypothetical protein [Phycisphaerae bacterium]
MLSRSIPLFLLVFGLGVLVAGNLGGCPSDLASLLPSAGDDTGDTGDTGDADVAEKTLHERIFVDILGKTVYENTANSCLICHSDDARNMLETAHWNWEGPVTNIEGLEGGTHGKRDLINNL